MSRFLDDNLVNVTVFSPFISGKYETKNSLLQSFQLPFPDNKMRFLNNPSPVNFFWYVALNRAMRKNEIDVLIIRNLRLALAGIFAAKLRRIPVVLDLAENMPAMVQIEGQYRRGKILSIVLSWFVKILERICVTLVDMVWVVAEANRKRILRFRNDPGTIIVIGNTPEIEEFVQMTGHPKNRNKEDLSMVYVGIITRQRGLDNLIQAVRDLREKGVIVSLDVIGDGRDRTRLEQLVNDTELNSQVNFHGWVSSAEIAHYLIDFDLGVIPHYLNELTNTTIPNKIYDYMSIGLPVLSTTMKPVEEIVQCTHCGWVVEPTIDGLSSKIQEIAALSKSDLVNYGQNGRNAVLNELNWEVDGKRLYKALHELVCEMQMRKV